MRLARIEEILQHCKTCFSAFFRMKLGGNNISFLDAAAVFIPIISRCQNAGIIFRNDVIGMNKIKLLFTGQTIKNP